MSRRAAFLRGARDMVPVVLGGIPFGLIAGVAGARIGLGALEATGASAVIFAGAAQLATYDLLTRDAPAAIVFFTAVLINMRFIIYSAAIAPTFRGEGLGVRALYAYLLTDQAYAVSAARRLQEPAGAHGGTYYLGSAVTLWAMWVSTTWLGASVGAAIPPAWSLDFAVPLCFAALLVPAVKDRAQVWCIAITAAVAVVARGAPHGSGVIISILVGIAAGALLSRRAPA